MKATSPVKLTNVEGFIDKCAQIVGKYEQDNFPYGQEAVYILNDIDSPIEKLFFTAFEVLTRITLYDINRFGYQEKRPGLYLLPQHSIGKYRVDFLAAHIPYTGNKEVTIHQIIVECDSQEFHDRTERERRYEKERDRFLQSNGFKVFRFTGREIMEDPFVPAAEIISYLTSITKDDILASEYLPK